MPKPIQIALLVFLAIAVGVLVVNRFRPSPDAQRLNDAADRIRQSTEQAQ
jgi:hypothetical protein